MFEKLKIAQYGAILDFAVFLLALEKVCKKVKCA